MRTISLRISSRRSTRREARRAGVWYRQVAGLIMGALPKMQNISGEVMNKTELIDQISAGSDLSKADAGRALDAFIQAVKASLVQGEAVTLVGFGTFDVSERPARTGRNPRTGEAIEIAAARVPRFRPGKALKDAING